MQVDKKEFRSADYLNTITLPGEEWRDTGPYGYVDYLASSFGRIYSMKSGKIVTGNLRPDGYTQINIPIDNINKEIFIHVLICRAFHGNPPDITYTVDHVDRNKNNNVPNNLRWASKSEQVLNRDEFTPQKCLIAQIENNVIIDFHTEQSIMEIFDMDEIIIPPEGLYYNNYLWINEEFIDLDIIGEQWKPVSIDGDIIMISNSLAQKTSFA